MKFRKKTIKDVWKKIPTIFSGTKKSFENCDSVQLLIYKTVKKARELCSDIDTEDALGYIKS